MNTTITKWMVEQKIAVNGFAAGHIAYGLKLHEFDRATQESMCKLYRRWRPKTDKKNELLPVEVYDLVLAGIDPDDVPARQIEMVLLNGEKSCGRSCSPTDIDGDGHCICDREYLERLQERQ